MQEIIAEYSVEIAAIFVILICLFSCGIVIEKTRIADIRFRKRQREIQRNIEKVKRYSSRYHELLELNSRYSFYPIDPLYEFYVQVHSKAQFDRFDFNQNMQRIVKDQLGFFEDLLDDIRTRNMTYHFYQNEVSALPPYKRPEEIEALNMDIGFFEKQEQELCVSLLKCPNLTTEFSCIVNYVSPQGRKQYTDRRVFLPKDIEIFCRMEHESEEKRQTKEFQRKIMTDSLRYDIMKRDGFRCVLCGRTPNDGIKLHVDHIIPVSRGGKTEYSNLRTLCNTCNMGKRDKYDPYGYN